jgi:hypothetical protein
MSKVVTATIAPITADKLRLDTVEIPIKDPDIYSPGIVSMDPVVVTDETLKHAVQVAKQIVGMLDQLPATPLSGDLITLALAVLHREGC